MIAVLVFIIFFLCWFVYALLNTILDMIGQIKEVSNVMNVDYYDGPTPSLEDQYYWNERLYSAGLIDEIDYLKRLDEMENEVNINSLYDSK